MVKKEEVNRLPVSGMAVNVRQEMLQADYWLAKCKDIQKIIMTAEEILEMNKILIAESTASCFTDFSEADSLQVITKEKLLDLLNRYKLPEHDCYLNGKKADNSYWCSLLEKEGRERVKKENPVQYGFCVRRSDIRCLPTEERLFENPEDTLFDELQCSSILLNEPVIILHFSIDGKWSFILTNYTCGWIRYENIAVCKSVFQWRILQEEAFAVITENKFCLDVDPSNSAVSGLELTMGNKLILVPEKDLKETEDGRMPYSCYAVKIPVRAANGTLEFTVGYIPASHSVSAGYLEYTQKNVLQLAFASLGERYGWGGMFDAKDCSQYVMELYRCFGMQLGRNTTDQMAMSCQTLILEHRTDQEKGKILDTVPAGSALYFPGHTMIYLGKDGRNYYVISAAGSMNPEGAKEGKVKNIHTITVNDLSVIRRNGCTWMESLTMVKIFKKDKIHENIFNYTKDRDIL